MTTDKRGVQLIAEICWRKGIRKVVFSPGSRSAPLAIAFSNIPDIECLVIPDERVAGYFALGMAQQLSEPVAVVCTSGTAVLNLSPSVCEAFYQNIPLLVLTADRPDGAVNKGENQSIMQENIFGNHTVSKYSINGDSAGKKEKQDVIEAISHAVDDTMQGYKGPVHVNIHLSEPLYGITAGDSITDISYKEQRTENNVFISLKDLQKIKSEFTAAKSKMIIVGMRDYDDEFNEKLVQLSERKDLIIINENLSNVLLTDSVWNADATLSLLSNEKQTEFIPEMVVTMGGQIVSKKIKRFLEHKPKIHWDVPPGSSWGRGWAMFGEMFDPVEPINEMQFLSAIIETDEPEQSNYKDGWIQLSKQAENVSKRYLKQSAFCDLKVFETIIRYFPSNANVHYGNSTPVRYSNFFPHNNFIKVNANRGTSGIDGCVSTAAGAAYATGKLTVSVVGDLSFFYDSNALWNNYLSPNFRIIVINNSGGNVFRLIDGPTEVKDFEKFFETKHNLTAKHLAAMYGLPYYFCTSQNELEETLKAFYEPSKKAKILEVKTDGILSADIYRKYFDYLRQNRK